MSVCIVGKLASYDIGFGNKCFAFLTGMIYAELNNLYLHNFSLGRTNILEIDYESFNENKEHDPNLKDMGISSNNYNNDGIAFYGKKNYKFGCFFQHSDYLNKHKDIIFKYVKVKKIEIPKSIKDYKIEDNDLLCFIRLGDKVNKNNTELVHPDYFKEIVDKNNFNKMYFVVFPENDSHIDKYFSYFDDDYKKKIIFLNKSTMEEDFSMVNYFKNIALDTSTFHWWSIFLNNTQNKKIFTPKKFGYVIQKHNNSFKSHGFHVKDLSNIKNETIILDNSFVFLV
jgi:hypothetical protein|tara:strand:+ start:154 stop:1002 length:849 start_codon:yes stop_codon:yes gene_type:complete